MTRTNEDMSFHMCDSSIRHVGLPADVLHELNGLLYAGGIAPIRSSPLPRCTRSECDDVSTRIGRVLVYVDDHLHEPLKVDHLAGEAGLSKYHFSRVFREEVGETPWAFVRRARVERAKKLLADGASSAAAAVESGFFDQSHFTNVLKDAEGRTPKQYQKARLDQSVRSGRIDASSQEPRRHHTELGSAVPEDYHHQSNAGAAAHEDHNHQSDSGAAAN